MIKFFGVLMIIASCSAMGITLNRDMRIRLKVIKGHIAALGIIKAEIIYKNTQLEKIIDLLEEHCGQEISFFYKETFRHASVGTTFSTAAQANYVILKKQGLITEDIEILKQVCSVLGRFDGAVQAERINTACSELQRSYDALKAEIASKGKLYKAIGATVGITLALIAI
ncbi:MAG: stage III sporulation protein AB [Clostridiaceae bacterium]|nr:stage III sporulation protein AB [Clostridiaceae bacterium]